MDKRERIIAFILEYAPYLLNRLGKGIDGKVPYERVRGKKLKILGIEFWEKVLYKLRGKGTHGKLNSRWDYGIFLPTDARALQGEVHPEMLQVVPDF